jgi:hypothetical protein
MYVKLCIPLVTFCDSALHIGRPSTAEPVNPVSPGDMRENITRWLDWVQDFVQQQVTALLSFVNSIRGLDGIREEASNLERARNWDVMCQQLLLPQNFNFWDAYFQPLITQRAKSLVSQQWGATLVQLQSTLAAVTQDSSQERRVMNFILDLILWSFDFYCSSTNVKNTGNNKSKFISFLISFNLHPVIE